jgi:transcriptional antiterminator RfaH
MPCLPLEPFLHPGDLLDEESRERCRLFDWSVLHTKPRAEKALARKLFGEEVCFFLPLSRKALKNRAGARPAYLPLFPGYVFLLGDEGSRIKALKTNQVVNCLAVPDQQELHEDLRHVYQLMNCATGLVTEPRLTRGARVEITAGPFAGMTGTILRRGSELRFAVEIHFLQQGVSVEMESWMLEPVAA